MAKKKNDKVEEIQPKMTIYDYEQKYVKRQNVRGAKFLLRFFAAAVGVLIFACLFSVTMRLWDLNMYVGIGAAAVSVLLFIFFYIVPLVKVMKLEAFQTNVNAYTAGKAKQHNKRLRRSVAEKIIDVTSKVEGVGWYDSAVVGALAIAVNTNDEEGIKKSLTEIYNNSVKKSARDLIFKASLKSASYSALSQTSKVDSLLVAFVNLQLIKDITFLYGFRPSDARLVKIFCKVLQNSLVAYGMGSARIGNSVVKTMGDAVRGIPLLGSAISTIVDSSVQGLTNGVLTTVIGYQTMKYLNDEYRLQDILDGIEMVYEEEEVVESCTELEKQLKRGKKLPQAS